MPQETITIRNVTANPLEVKLVERFEPHGASSSPIDHLTTTFANLTNSVGITNNVTRAAVPKLQEGAEPFTRQDVNIRIEPFQTVQTDIKNFDRSDKERIRLTFHTDQSGRHQMYCPVPTSEDSHTLAALDPEPKFRFTGIYLSQRSFAAIYNSTDLAHWMGSLPDGTPLSALSIPGTHNSPTYQPAPPSVRCQAVSPLDQLRNGVRFFDLRVQVTNPDDPNSDKLTLVHSVFPISLTGPKYFRDLYNTIVDFLRDNPSETLIVSLKREGTGNGTDQQLSQVLKRHYTNPERWFTEPRLPTLGEVRGRIVLLRRFDLDEPLKGEWDGKGWGIDAHVWEDNTPCNTCPSGMVCVQDFYEVLETENIDKKIEYCNAHLERSGACCFPREGLEHRDVPPLHVNFLSASNFWKVGTWPEKIAAKVNPACVEHLCQRHMEGKREDEGDWSTGIVVTDWVGLDGDWDLVRCVVGMNAKLLR